MPDPWRHFPYHRSGSALSFPRDEGWHRLLPGGLTNPSLDHMEWVYLNAHLEETDPPHRRFVVFVAYFTQHLRFVVVRAFDDQDRYLRTYTGTSWGALRASSETLDLTFDHGGGTDRWRSTGVPFASQLTATDDAGAFSLSLEMQSTKEPYDAGSVGAMPFGTRGSFFYYSLTRLAVGGALVLGDERIRVDGKGWFDHQWGPFYVTPFRSAGREEYEWMSIQLDSGDDIVLTTVWEANGVTPSLPAYGGAGLLRADGSRAELVGAHRWKRLGFWRAPDQHAVYSARWRFEAPEWNTSLEIVPRHEDQLTPIVDAAPAGLANAVARLVGGTMNHLGTFWEGSCRVTGTFEGAAVEGVAFAELIKRYETPDVSIYVMRNDPGLAVIGWRVENPDEQVPLVHRFYLERPDGEVLHQLDDLLVPVAVIDHGDLPRGERLIGRAVSESVDGSLSGTASLEIELR